VRIPLRISLGSLLFPTLLFLALPNWTSARRGLARTFRLSRSQQRPQLQQNRRVTPSGRRRTTPRGSGQIVPSEIHTLRNRASILFASRSGLSPSFEAAAGSGRGERSTRVLSGCWSSSTGRETVNEKEREDSQERFLQRNAHRKIKNPFMERGKHN
jgi:hypothetical protein